MAGTKPISDVQRRSGIALWRQVADSIRIGIAAGELGESGRLPAEIELSARFAVNRHTVRAAIAALVREGVLRADQGRGTFIVARKKLLYPISSRTRFSTGLEGQVRERRSILLSHAIELATAQIANALRISLGAPVLRMETLAETDGWPLSRATNWFDAERFAGFEQAYAETHSITEAFRRHGVDDYLRFSTTVSARHADAADLADLKLAPGAVVLVTTALNVDLSRNPVQFAEARFAADRVELSVTPET